MAISLASIKRSTMGAPRVVVYGVPGIGKTTLAAQADSPIFIQTEDGLGALDVLAFPKANSYADVLDALQAILDEPNDYRTVVVDTLDALEPLLWAHVCAQGGKKSIEDFGYGKGFSAAAAEWRNLLRAFDALRDSGRMILLLAHSTVVRFEAPDSDPYDRYQLRLDKRSEAVVTDWADAVLFANYEVAVVGDDRKRGVGKGSRKIHTAERPAWRAKNRYRMPDTMPMEWAQIEQAIAGTVPATA